MAQFYVADTFHSHPKLRRCGLEAVGLWAVCGSLSVGYLTDGFVDENYVKGWPHGLLLARRLVDAGLWEPAERNGETGWSFHDWRQFQPTRSRVESQRDKWREKKARQRLSPGDSPGDTRGTWGGTWEGTRARPEAPNGASARAPTGAHARERSPGAATSATGARGASNDSNTDYNWSEIPNCDLCDDEGRKPNGMVCDHIDRRFTAARGSKQLRETMGWKT